VVSPSQSRADGDGEPLARRGATSWQGHAPSLLASALVAALALLLYVPTLLPDVGTWDTAEFQAIGPVLGIAHPTGYPTYTLLAWLASVVLQPFGNEAYRADLLSALLMAGAAALLAMRIVQATRRWPLGVLGGVLFVLTPLAWRLSTRADAHVLHVFLAMLLLVLLASWAAGQRRGEARAGGGWLLAAAVVFGLALGNHALTLLLAPGVAAYVLLVAPRILWQRWRLVLACAAAMLATTALVYAYLPLRSSMDPPLDYADPETWGAFWYVVLGQQFQGAYGGPPSVTDLLAGAWDTVVANLGALAVLVPAGAILGALRHPRLLALTGLWFVCTGFFALRYANADIERYYLVPLAVAAIWVALAVDVAWDALLGLLEGRRRAAPDPGSGGLATTAGSGVRVRPRRLLAVVLPWALVAVLLGTALSALPARRRAADASGETFGRAWLEAAFAAIEPDAAVMSWWSFSTPLWYGRWVEGRRDDIVIVDDRDVTEQGFDGVEGAIDHYLGERPVYVIRLARDLPALAARYRMERVEGVPSPGDLYRVLGRRDADASGRADGPGSSAVMARLGLGW
jgi:hypothetical protein